MGVVSAFSSLCHRGLLSVLSLWLGNLNFLAERTPAHCYASLHVSGIGDSSGGPAVLGMRVLQQGIQRLGAAVLCPARNRRPARYHLLHPDPEQGCVARTRCGSARDQPWLGNPVRSFSSGALFCSLCFGPELTDGPDGDTAQHPASSAASLVVAASSAEDQFSTDCQVALGQGR